MDAMASKVWGTFAVNDHCRESAFASEVLLFDRLVLPVPQDAVEEARWRQPDEKRPDVTWDPDRQRAILELLGTQHRKSKEGDSLAFEVPWSERLRPFEEQRTEVAERVARDVASAIKEDAFAATRWIVAMGDALPKQAIEAVAAFPSEKVWRAEIALRSPPGPAPATHALLRFSRPLLLAPPEPDPGELRNLRHAMELARDPEYQRKRDAYYAWVRNQIIMLGKDSWDAILSEAAAKRLQDELAGLIAEERAVVRKHDALKMWKPVEYGFVTVAAVAGVAAAFAAPALAAPLGAGGAAAGFFGWAAGKVAPPARPLGGGAMFVAAERHFKPFWEEAAGR